jgi:hypothetical protein
MRTVVAVLAGAVLAGTLGLAACGPSPDQKRAAADARAKDFTPPSVTSRLDYGGLISRRFRTLDRDADDVLTADELPRRNTRLWALDRNKDGKIGSVEFSDGMLARFDRMDLNHDGTVTSEEREAAKAQGLVK